MFDRAAGSRFTELVSIVPLRAPGAEPDTTWYDSGGAAVALARAQLRAAMAARGADRSTVGRAELLVSELVTNVVRHTSSARVGVRIRHAAALRVDVIEDAVSAVPDHAHRGIDDVPVTATSGRGMGLVDGLATQWGITRRGRVTTTWFEIAPDEEHVEDGDWPDRGSGEREMVRRSQLLLLLTEALSRADTPEQVGDAVTSAVRDHVGAYFVGIALADRDAATMRYLSLDPLPARTVARWDVVALDGASPVSRVALDGDPLFHASVEEAEAAFPGIGEHMRDAGTAAMAHLPLTSGGVTFGTLAVAWREPLAVHPETRVLLLVVAGYAAQALARR